MLFVKVLFAVRVVFNKFARLAVEIDQRRKVLFRVEGEVGYKGPRKSIWEAHVYIDRVIELARLIALILFARHMLIVVIRAVVDLYDHLQLLVLLAVPADRDYIRHFRSASVSID